MQLVAGDGVFLCAGSRFEIDDRELVGVEPPDEVDPAVDDDAGGHVDLDLLLAVDRLLEFRTVQIQVALD